MSDGIGHNIYNSGMNGRMLLAKRVTQTIATKVVWACHKNNGKTSSLGFVLNFRWCSKIRVNPPKPSQTGDGTRTSLHSILQAHSNIFSPAKPSLQGRHSDTAHQTANRSGIGSRNRALFRAGTAAVTVLQNQIITATGVAYVGNGKWTAP